jgi:hypothetical protein
MKIKSRPALHATLWLACGICPILAAGSAAREADPNAPKKTSRWALTNEHGEVLYEDRPEYEFQFARLMYTENPNYVRFGGIFGETRWTTDSPSAEIHLSQGIRRLTRIHAASEPTAVALTDDTLFDHPLIYAVEVGGWDLSEKEAARLREYLDRGGTLLVDDFHGTWEWTGFMESLSRVYPDRQVVDIPDGDAVFHILYDLTDRPQIPGWGSVLRGVTFERDGYQPHWRGIYDDKNRLTVIINFNMDMGDAWEHADNPEYPQHLTGIAYRITINQILYAMTH